ncbi:MAG: helix-turn-helix transcriptional regulator [Alphaproteobacteria bacterium]|jgi:DNA-binding CsgD family transcriptional regulator|nr:helix-turn-helix transcriptional regulator [Alphaproteobacteria bacterium]MBT5390417.1 helix-turn-helix transcriptional regulator [Alphaproteobacteria bacterium]
MVKMIEYLKAHADEISQSLKYKHCPREIQCLYFLSRGFSMKETGRLLGISHRTVETYIVRIKEKLSLNYKSELILYYFKHIEPCILRIILTLRTDEVLSLLTFNDSGRDIQLKAA